MFEISSKNAAIVTLVILAGIMLFAGLAFRPQFESPTIAFKEEPLEKNSKLQISPGEEYRYRYSLNGTELNITYSVLAGKDCTVVLLEESTNYTHICIDEWGVDSTGSNSTFKEPAFILFKPWMLALHSTWRWNSSMYMDFEGLPQHLSDSHYRVLRTENYSGRMAYVVEINSTTAPIEYQWVDAEKRIALKIMGERYQVELVE